jgi:hypothetical protein
MRAKARCQGGPLKIERKPGPAASHSPEPAWNKFAFNTSSDRLKAEAADGDAADGDAE